MLTSLGIHAFILRYRVAPHRHQAPLVDAKRAMQWIRGGTHGVAVDRARTGVLGFSAGGHLAAALSAAVPTGEPALDGPASVPDLAVLCYPVVSFTSSVHQGCIDNLLGEAPSDHTLDALSAERHVTDSTPPTFAWHTSDDPAVDAAHSLLFTAALRLAGVPAELHIVPHGRHGLGLAAGVRGPRNGLSSAQRPAYPVGMTARSPGPTGSIITTAEAAWSEVERLFGVRGEPSRCWCRFFALTGAKWRESAPEDRKNQLRAKFDGGAPSPGVLAFRGGLPVGWCAVEPRDCYPRLLHSKVLKASGQAAGPVQRTAGNPGAGEGTSGDGTVWSVSCFVVARGHRRSGVARALLRAAVDHAFTHGAAVVEGYPVNPQLRPKAGPADLYQGTLKLFLGAGFEVVSEAVPGRAVVRLTAPG